MEDPPDAGAGPPSDVILADYTADNQLPDAAVGPHPGLGNQNNIGYMDDPTNENSFSNFNIVYPKDTVVDSKIDQNYLGINDDEFKHPTTQTPNDVFVESPFQQPDEPDILEPQMSETVLEQNTETPTENDSRIQSIDDASDMEESKQEIKRPGRRILPARRLPRYLPDVDGNIWKVWPYPDVQELDTGSETDSQYVEAPEGTKAVVDDDPNSFSPDLYGPRVFRRITIGMGVLIFLGNVILLVRWLYSIWEAAVLKKVPEEPPEGQQVEESSDSEKSQYLEL